MTSIEKIRAALAQTELDALLLTDDKNILYATGFRPTDSAALITRERAFLVTDSRYIEAAEKAVYPGVEVSVSTREKKLAACLRELTEANGVKALGAEEEYVSVAQCGRLREALGLELLPGQSLMTKLRQSKTREELESLTAAQRIAERAFEEVLPLIRPGMSERAVAAELTYRMLLHGGEGNSFDPIVVAGAKTSMPHGVPGDELIKDGDFLTLDFGTIKNGYCSDMTRTVAVGGVTDEMRRVYEIVFEAQAAGIAAARPGVSGAEIHMAAASVIADAGYGEYFGHGFGHGVGLDVHEAPSANISNAEPMPEGAVISAEPGIYLPGRFGVRIEDVLYLTGEGRVNLTKADKELIIL